MNNPNVVSPYGTQTTTWNGDQPTVVQQFSPDQQDLYNTNLTTQRNLGLLGNTGSSALQDVIGKNLDYSSVTAQPNLDYSSVTAQPGNYESTRQAVIDAMMNRYNITAGQNEEQTKSDLTARGINSGNEAYAREMDRIDRAANDYRSVAEATAGPEVQRAFGQDSALRAQQFGEVGTKFGQDSELRRQQIAEMLAGRQTPLNEITALMSGSQVSNPFSQASVYNGGATAAPAPVLAGTQMAGQAANDIYNSQAGAYGNMMSGLFGMGGAVLGNPFGPFGR
jgi:hypothetical protein